MINKTSTTLISVEGLDCSFKETNVAALKNKLEEEGYSVLTFDFPQYSRDSSYFIRQFLHNPLYRDPEPLTVDDCCKYCMYYSLDRYDTYLTEIKQHMGKVDVIIFDRFINSNLHNVSRMMPDMDKALDVLDWLYKFEYGTLNLPSEDICIFLNMPYDKSRVIRQAKSDKDLNEIDEEFSKKSYTTFDMLFNHEKAGDKKIIKRLEKITGITPSKMNHSGIGPMFTINVDIGIEDIDFVKTLTDEEEREKSKKLIFDKIYYETSIFIESAIGKRRELYGKEEG